MLLVIVVLWRRLVVRSDGCTVGGARQQRANGPGRSSRGRCDVAVREPEPPSATDRVLVLNLELATAPCGTLNATQRVFAELVAHARLAGLLRRRDLREIHTRGHRCARGGDERLLRRGGLWLITGSLRTQPLRRRRRDRFKLPRQRIHN